MVARDSIKKLVSKKQLSIDGDSPREAAAFVTADKLENEDKSDSEDQKISSHPDGDNIMKDIVPSGSVKEKAKSIEKQGNTVELGGSKQGIDNKAFKADEDTDQDKTELIVRVIPPTVHNTLEREEESLPVKKTSPTKSKTEKMEKISGPTKSGQGENRSLPTTSAMTSQSHEETRQSPSPSSTPSAKSDKFEKGLKPETSPNQRSTTSPEEYQFDPEGKSAISGQKRTGWI